MEMTRRFKGGVLMSAEVVKDDLSLIARRLDELVVVSGP